MDTSPPLAKSLFFCYLFNDCFTKLRTSTRWVSVCSVVSAVQQHSPSHGGVWGRVFRQSSAGTAAAGNRSERGGLETMQCWMERQKNRVNMSGVYFFFSSPAALPNFCLVGISDPGLLFVHSGLFSCGLVKSLLLWPKGLAGTLKAHVAMGSLLYFPTVFHGMVPRDILVLCSFGGQKVQVHTRSWIQAGLCDPEVPELEISV